VCCGNQVMGKEDKDKKPKNEIDKKKYPKWP
jgi:hypothetical protein